MSLLLDALKKAAARKEENSEAAITQTVNIYDKTSIIEETQTEIDNTFSFDENRFESKITEVVDDAPALTQLEDVTKVLDDVDGRYEDVTQIIKLQESDDLEKTALSYNEDVTKILPHNEIDSDATLELVANQPDKGAVKPEETSLASIKSENSILTQTKVSDEATLLTTDMLVPETILLNSQITGAQTTRPTLNLNDVQEYEKIKNDTINNRLVDHNETVKEDSESPQDSDLKQNYAHDNYDRTLIKIDQDDASQLFSGMKSDSDALMTPEYARKVFISNSSIQRTNRYKIHTGVAASIVLFIFILGLFEFEEKALNIDNTLKSLKQDPMPKLPQLSEVKKPLKPLMPSKILGLDLKKIVLVENTELPSSVTVQKTKVTSEEVKVGEAVKAKNIRIALNEEKPVAKVKILDSIKTNVIQKRKILIQVSKKELSEKPKRLLLSSKMAFTLKDKLLNEAYAMHKLGDNTGAIRKYNQVIKADPVNRSALLARASISVQNNDRNSAIDDYQTLLIENPKDSLAMSSLISVANISSFKLESQLKGMIREEPSSPHLNFALANVYGAQNRWYKAQSLYFKALNNNPNDPNYAYNFAVSLEHISKPKLAITYYQRALVNFNNGIPNFKKAVVQKRLETLKKL